MALLRDILLLAALAIFLLIICHRLGIPAIVGFLLAGVLGGPGSLGIISQSTDVEMLSQVGIILLLFTIGLEFSIKKIYECRRHFLLGGALQVALTVFGGFIFAKFLGHPSGEALFWGFLVSMSSTAIVLKILQEKNQTSTPAAKAILGILIFQDVIAIPMMLLIPLLGGATHLSWGWDIFLQACGGLFLLGSVLWAAISLMPRLLDLVAKTRSRELFLLTVLAACFSVAWLTSLMGLSLSIGAFLAGLIISDSEYSTEAIGDILPFRDLFTSFFFVSIGMLCNIHCLIENPFLVIAAVAAVILLKSSLAGASILTLGLPLRAAIFGGLALSQVGEFSFVLAKLGSDVGLGTPILHQLFLDVSLLSMALTPFLLCCSDSLSTILLKLPLPHGLKSGFRPQTLNSEAEPLKDHVIIVGFGMAGCNLAHTLKASSIPYIILEMNSETVKKEKLKGEPIHYGDISHESVLIHLGIEHARAMAILINDATSALRAVKMAHKLRPDLYIIGRVRRMQEIPLMIDWGASEVVPDEFGTSIEVLTRVLRLYQISWEEIEAHAAELRSEGYNLLQRSVREPIGFSEDLGIRMFKVEHGSPLAGKTLLENNFRRITGLTVMMIRRAGESMTVIDASTRIHEDDQVTLMGSKVNLNKAHKYFQREETPPSFAQTVFENI